MCREGGVRDRRCDETRRVGGGVDATPAKPGRVADTAAPSRRLATHRRAVFVVARKRKHIYENSCALRRCRQFAVFCINRSVHPINSDFLGAIDIIMRIEYNIRR